MLIYSRLDENIFIELTLYCQQILGFSNPFFHETTDIFVLIKKLFNDFLIHFSTSKFDSLVQDCSNSIANTLELLQSCTKLLYYKNKLASNILYISAIY